MKSYRTVNLPDSGFMAGQSHKDVHRVFICGERGYIGKADAQVNKTVSRVTSCLAQEGESPRKMGLEQKRTGVAPSHHL